MDSLTLRDQQYDILQRHFVQIRNDNIFNGLSLATLRIKKELIQEAFDKFRQFHLIYRSENSNCLVFQGDLYEEVEDDFTTVMSRVDEQIGNLQIPHNDSLASDVPRTIRVEHRVLRS